MPFKIATTMWPRQRRLNLKLYTCSVLSILVAFTSMMPLPTLSVPLPSASDGSAQTIYYRNVPPNALGHYSYEFQTSNGITTKAAGNEHGSVGVVQFVSLEGIPVTFTYVADANGYHPEGAHLPQVPLHVHRSLDYIRTHPAVDEKKSRGI